MRKAERSQISSVGEITAKKLCHDMSNMSHLRICSCFREWQLLKQNKLSFKLTISHVWISCYDQVVTLSFTAVMVSFYLVSHT